MVPIFKRRTSELAALSTQKRRMLDAYVKNISFSLFPPLYELRSSRCEWMRRPQRWNSRSSFSHYPIQSNGFACPLHRAQKLRRKICNHMAMTMNIGCTATFPSIKPWHGCEHDSHPSRTAARVGNEPTSCVTNLCDSSLPETKKDKEEERGGNRRFNLGPCTWK